MKKLIGAVLFLVATLTAAPPDPVAWKLEGAPSGAIKPGAQFTVKLAAKIQSGWHLYSMKPVENGPIPTRISLSEGPFDVSGSIRATDPKTLEDPSFGMEVELYERDATFTIPIRAAAGAPPGARQLTVNVSYQSCNNKICLPPKTVKLDIPVTIGK